MLSRNKLSSNSDQAGVYKIECKNCDKVYIGETGRTVRKRVSEHRYDISKKKESSALAMHVKNEKHDINFDSAKLVYRCNNTTKRRIVESSLISVSNTLNLNKGFYLINNFASNCITKCLDLKDKT